MFIDNNSLPLVSVVIPSYNHQDFVQHTLKSVLDQDYENIELIIIDDGSSDNSVEKIKEMVKDCERRFKRFEFRSRENRGLCRTLNEALEWCEGEFFSIVASDDIWLPHKTKIQVKLFLNSENSNIGVISGEMIKIDSQGKMDREASFIPQNFSFYDFKDIYYGKARINAPTAMISMKYFKETGGYKDDVIIEDFYMWLAITSLGCRIMSVNENFAKYRIHDNNTFSKIEKMHKAKIDILTHFSPSQEIFSESVRLNNIKDFKAAAIYQKRYALKLLYHGDIGPIPKEIIPYVAIIFIPKNIFMKSIDFYRALKS